MDGANARPRRRGAAWIASALAPLVACAQIESVTEFEVLDKEGAEPRVIGPPTGAIVRRGLIARWTQNLDSVELHLVETRECQAMVHQPVVRIDRIRRTPDGSIYWEYGLGAAILGVGIMSFACPQCIAGTVQTTDGGRVPNTQAGYRLGALFTTIGAILAIAGIYDTVRARDEVQYTDAFRVVPGDEIACEVPRVDYAQRSVELLIGEWKQEGITDDRGRVELLLPPEATVEALYSPAEPGPPDPDPQPPTDAAPPEPAEDLPPMPPGSIPRDPPAEEAAPRPAPATRVRKGVLRIDENRAVAFDFVVPYGVTGRAPHTGAITLPPLPAG